MTNEQFHREKRYFLALSIAKSMLSQGVIDESDFRAIDTKLMEKFHPVREGLRSKTT
ncbi:MAG TPA: SHOCT domain-containing protein [Caproicibacter sp.]|nr:SHOCT domain-containing protein [Caproicibacter sp.]